MSRVKPNGQRSDIFEDILEGHGFTEPFDYMTEVQVVGAFLKEPLRLNEFQKMLSLDAFYDSWTKRVIENIYQYYQSGETEKINPEVLVLNTSNEHRDRVIRDILNHTRHIPSDELKDMIKTLNELSFRRNMLNTAFCILEDFYDCSSSMAEKIAYAEEISKRIIKYTTDFKKQNPTI